MPFTRSRQLRDKQIEEELLQNDDDSDIDIEDDDAGIEEVIDKYRQIIENLEGFSDDEQEESAGPAEPAREFAPPPSRRAKRRGQGRAGRGRARSGSGRSRGRTNSRGHRTSRAHSAPNDYRALDEAVEWSYQIKQTAADEPQFEGEVGVQIETSPDWCCYDFLSLYCTAEFWKLLKRETNRYAAPAKASLSRRGLLKPNSFLTSWTPVTEGEMKAFMAIIIHMSLVKKETLDSYWSTNLFINTPFPGRVMSRQRFRAIYSCLHLNDNSNYIPRGQENYDAFFKLRPFFDMLLNQCKSLFLPDENLTIDEGTCGFRGRVHFRVFNKDKPDKYGMKIYMLCESDTGYVLNMVPYVGDSKTVETIIFELMEGYLDKWHTVYMDRFFTSPTVFDLLFLRNTRAVGTVMSNRKGLPKQWVHQPLELNEMAFCHRGSLTACKWKDRRDVPFLTTKHVAKWTEVSAKSKSGIINKAKPDCILDYNTNKVGVDLNDQYVSYYSHNRKSMKWWKKMFFHLFARTTVNAYIIHNKSQTPGKRRIPFSTFLLRCGESMVEESGLNMAQEHRSQGAHVQDIARLSGRHFIEPIPPTASKQKPYKVCKVCAESIKVLTGARGRKETQFHCEDCKVPLCIHPCFKKYHTLRDFTK